MRTPAGKECRYYFQDYHRGRSVQECRLASENPASLRWRAHHCAACPVPDILNANASPDLHLQLTIKPRLLGLGSRIETVASCLKHRVPVDDPFIGCAQCNAERPGMDIFQRALGPDNR
jgi:hypothetical protein